MSQTTAITPFRFPTPTNRWPKWALTELQANVVKSKARFKVLPCGRRSGKTELAKLVLSTVALYGYSPAVGRYRVTHSEPRNYFVAAPTLNQARRIYWDDLKRLIPKWAMKSDPRESDMTIELKDGAKIYVLGMDKPERIEGMPWDGGVLDEYGNMKEKAWKAHVRPALSDRNGWAWLIGVPEGRNHYFETYKKAVACLTNEWAGFTWKSSDILPPAEIQAAREDLDELTFLQEYEASFVTFSGRAYYRYGEENIGSLTYDPWQPISFCFDFNVSPGVAGVCQEQVLPGKYKTVIVGDDSMKVPVIGTGCIGEVWIPNNSNTLLVCNRLIKDWGNHQSTVYIYGDATGGSRGSAKVLGSDWDLIRQAFRNSPLRDKVVYRVPSHNPQERTRVNALNSRIRSATSDVRLMVDRAKAPHIDADLDGVRTVEGGSGEIDKKADPKLTHISDAIGYYIAYEFPISGGTIVKDI